MSTHWLRLTGRKLPRIVSYFCAALCFSAALGCVHAAGAQQTQPSTYLGFEGQPVTDVEIAAAPDVDVAAIRKLISQQPAQPFSAQALQQSVAALQQTQRFTEVQVSLQPQPAGLQIIFILQPADYVGVVQFPGTGTRFSYASLLQAVNIPEQSPYLDSLQNSGQRRLRDFLEKHGFFEASIEPEIQRDEPHHIVNIIYHCRLNRQAKIRDVEFTGLTEEQAAGLRGALHGWWARLKRVSLKPGQKYSQPRAAKSIAFIRDHLRKSNQLAPAIQLNASNYDPSTKRVDVIFHVTPGPKVSVQVEGARVSAKTLRRLIPIYEEGSVDQDLVDEGENNLRAYFQSKGFYDVTTDSQIERRDDVVNVVYDVTPGSKHHLKRIDFDGNHHFSDRELKPNIKIKTALLPLPFFHGTYDEQLVNKSVTALTQLYKNAGYGSVSIQPKVEDFEPEIDVTFLITEGPRDSVGSVRVIGNKTQTLAALETRSPLQLQPGDIFSQKLLETGRTQLLAAYLDLGYLNAAVRSAASPAPDDPHKFNVTYTVDEGAQSHISQVVMLGQKETHPQFLQEVASEQVKPGDPLSQGKMLQAESDLYDLGVFDWSNVEPLRPVVNQTQEELLVKVHESPLNSMDIGGGIEIIPRDGNLPVNSVAVPGIPAVSLGNKFTVSQKSYIGPRFTFAFTRHDIRGRAETATIGTVLSRLDQRGFFTYADPRLRGSSWSSLFNLSGERTTQNPIYTAELGQVSFQVEKALDAKRTKQAILRYNLQRTNLYDLVIPGLVLPEDRHVRLSTVEGEYVRDTRDKPLDAHHGIYQTFDLGVTSTKLGATADFVRFLGQTAFYIPVTPSLVWANNFRVGFAVPFSDSHVPLSERFFSGGADSLRGFPINGAGPQRAVPVCGNPADQSTCTLISVPVGGDMLFIVNSELRFPLPIYHGLGAAVFYDGGNVYSNINFRQFADQFTHSVGGGLRYQTPIGPVRIDLGYRITSVPGVKSTQYFVTLGQSF